MKFKNIFYIALLSLIMAFYGCGNRYENTYVITAENGVNVRAIPSTSGKVLGKKSITRVSKWKVSIMVGQNSNSEVEMLM